MQHSLLMLGLAGACVACSPPGREEALGLARMTVTGGAPTNAFPSVVALLDEQGQTFCSGVVVSTTEILSAAHCVLPPAPELAWLSTDHRDAPALLFEAASVWLHPDFDPETHAHDLARIVTRSPMGLEHARLPMAALTAQDAGRWVQVVGFGLEGLHGGGDRKMAGLSLLENADEESLLLSPAPATPCNGDSGGGVFSDEEPQSHLVGVISRGDALCGAYAIATPVDRSSLVALRPLPEAAGCAVSGGTRRTAPTPLFALVLLLLQCATRSRRAWIRRRVPPRQWQLSPQAPPRQLPTSASSKVMLRAAPTITASKSTLRLALPNPVTRGNQRWRSGRG